MNPYPAKPRHPIYLSLSDEQWEKKLERSRKLASPCILCGRRCQARRFVLPENVLNKNTGEPVQNTGDPVRPVKGICQTGDMAVVSSAGPHFGEEPPLVGQRGSGTIFFAGCNMKCIYCQNYDIAHYNINLVSPTHVVPNILTAVRLAAKQGLHIPIVYNTGGYDSLETVKLLDGIVDIYMPDMKYGKPEPAREFSGVTDYPDTNFAAVKEMHRQVGDLVIGKNNVAVRGLLVRHLVLPGELADTRKVMEFLACHISRNTYVNIMSQYRPYHKAVGHPVLGRRINSAEYSQALQIAAQAGLTRVQAF